MGNMLKHCYVQKCCVKEESLIVNKKFRYSNDGTVGKIITNNCFFVPEGGHSNISENIGGGRPPAPLRRGPCDRVSIQHHI